MCLYLERERGARVAAEMARFAICDGADGSGDLYNDANADSFVAAVRRGAAAAFAGAGE